MSSISITMGLISKLLICGVAVLLTRWWTGSFDSCTPYITAILATLLSLWVWNRMDGTLTPEMIRGKRVIITGASSGIGEHLAYKYAELGASVFICARREELLKKVTEKCEQLGQASGTKSKCGYKIVDMLDMDSIDSFVEEAVAFMGGLDHLIINHGDLQPQDAFMDDKDSFDRFKKIMDVNLFSCVKLATACVPHLKLTRGCIGLSGSQTGYYPVPYAISYSSSKAAVDKFFWGLRQEFRLTKTPVSITICVIGLIETDAAFSFAKSVTDSANISMDTAMKILPPVTVQDSAEPIIKAVTQKKEWLPYPSSQWIKTRMILAAIWPKSSELV